VLEEQARSFVRVALERVLAREGRCAPGGGQTGSPAPAPPAAAAPAAPRAASPRPRAGVVALASDHGGFELKEKLFARLREDGWSVRDLGTHSSEAVDYPDFALKVAAMVAKGEAFRGIVVDGVGVGSAIAANKVPGIRAATCFDAFSTKNAREHNDANVLCVGGRVLDPEKALDMARIFLETDFGGERHARRVDKITAIERMFLGAAGRRER
jgi:ribose 5-phosphate isomerase B